MTWLAGAVMSTMMSGRYMSTRLTLLPAARSTVPSGAVITPLFSMVGAIR